MPQLGLGFLIGALSGGRRVWATTDRVHIEVRIAPPGDIEVFSARMEEALNGHTGVYWSELCPELGRVVIAADPSVVSGGELIDIVDAVEAACAVGDEPFARNRAGHPADVEPLVQEAVKMAADVVGVGLGVVGRLAFVGPARTLRVAGTAMAVVNGVPPVRRLVDARFSSPMTGLALSVGNAIGQGLAQAPLGPLTDLVHHGATFAELEARRRAFLRREPDLFAKPSFARPAVIPVPRPVPVPDGPVERFSNGILGASVVGAGALGLISGDVARGAGALGLSLPKAAVYGRSIFASSLGRTLADRGALVVDPDALRVLDRVDCLVVEADLLTTGDLVVGDVVTVGVTDGGEVRARLRSLFDPGDPLATRVAGSWALGPLADLDGEVPRRLRRRAVEMGQCGGPVLLLRSGGKPAALIQTTVALRSEAEDLVALARAAQLEIVLASASGMEVVPLDADRTVGDGADLGEAVRSLQAEGRVVLVVAGGGSSGLAAADVGVGVVRRDEPLPWGADIVCAGGLLDACLVVEACATAREVSRQSARLALAGVSVGAFLSLRRSPGASFGAATAINTAALVSMAAGTRAAVRLANQPRPLPRDPTPWHALEPHIVLDRLGVSPAGLTPREAVGRLPHRPAPLPPVIRLGRNIVDEIFNPLTPVLAVGAGLSLVTGSAGDAAMVLAVVGLNAVIGGVQRFRADEAFAAIERTGRREACVIRDGHEARLDADDLVPGDVVRLRAGDAVVADCRILSGSSVEADESSLTGESFPVAKGVEPTFAPAVADRTSMLYDATSLAAGEATAVVVATGAATQARRAAAGRAAAPETGVEARLQHLTRMTIPVALGSGVAMVAAGLLRGQAVGDLTAGAVSLTVAAVPEGLPLLATVAELSAARRLAVNGVLVRNSRAVEALGRVQVMCVDKTGTVTEGRITLEHVSDGSAPQALAALTPAGRRILAAALRATPAVDNGGRLPHPTDWAVVTGAERVGVTSDDIHPGSSRRAELHFEPARGFHATLWAGAGQQTLEVKGAPEIVVPRCATWRRDTGQQPLDDEARTEISAELRRLTRHGFRVLAVAERSASSRAHLDDDRVRDLSFLGFLAFTDPVRSTAAQAVSDLRAAGIGTVMITGDHPSTAEGIAVELGLISETGNGSSILTGAELEELSDDDLDARLDGLRVVARVTPTHKVRIVRAFQRAGRVVAMTGDGANDAPAIRLADVGIALGRRSTSAARDAADLVVLDDRIETLVHAVAEGRAMWASVRDAVALLVGGNLGEIAFTVGAALLGGRAPLSARQLLVLNLLTDVAPAMAIAVQPPARRSFAQLLDEGPEQSLGAALDRAILWRAACTGGAATGAWAAARLTGSSRRARTVGFAALVGSQLGQTLVVGRPQPATVVALAGSAGVLVALIQVPGLSQLFGCQPLGPAGWTIAGLATGISTGASVVVPRLAARLGREGPELILDAAPAAIESEPVLSSS